MKYNVVVNDKFTSQVLYKIICGTNRNHAHQVLLETEVKIDPETQFAYIEEEDIICLEILNLKRK